MQGFAIRDRVADLVAREPVRFVLAGGAAAALFYALTFAVLHWGAPPFAGTLAAYAVTVVTSYTVQHSWTFRGRRAHGHAFPRYVAAQVVSALTAATLAGSAVSYGLSRYWVFAQTSTACSSRPTSPKMPR